MFMGFWGFRFRGGMKVAYCSGLCNYQVCGSRKGHRRFLGSRDFMEKVFIQGPS